MNASLAVFLSTLAVSLLAGDAHGTPRPRLRELGVEPGILSPGPLNAITDVEGVRVGHCTLIRGDSVRTGVTAILPHPGNLFQRKVPAAVYVGNGFGKAAGFLQVGELGNLETPIILTNTLSVGTAVDALVAWTLQQPGNEAVRSVNAVVGETNDGYLNDIRGRHVGREDIWAALAAAQSGAVAEGCVGAGVGTRALGWKGGIGTASRKLHTRLGGYTVGALVQSNFGGVLSIDGVPVGERLGRYAFRDALESPSQEDPGTEAIQPERGEKNDSERPQRKGDTGSNEDIHHNEHPERDKEDAAEHGSCMIVVATDAPLSPRNLERLARRAVLGLARTGSFMSNGSGDFVIAFSIRNQIPDAPEQAVQPFELLHNNEMSPLFLATVEAVEEAVYNSLLKATTMTGQQNRSVDAIPIEPLRKLLER